jgi:hypothetical protein
MRTIAGDRQAAIVHECAANAANLLDARAGGQRLAVQGLARPATVATTGERDNNVLRKPQKSWAKTVSPYTGAAGVAPPP